MVDRVSLIKTLEPCVKPTQTQVEVIRKALDKALAETILGLPLCAAAKLPPSVQSELEVVVNSFDQKQAERLAASWEPQRKPDVEMKRAVKKDLVELLRGRRSPYEPIAVSLDEARAGDPTLYRTLIERVAPTKDLKSLLSKWDKNLKPAPTARLELVKRLIALLEGAAPTPKATAKQSRH
ncbi:MAG: hypothetical protein WBX25_34560 [Rhodomicrobium sp.]